MLYTVGEVRRARPFVALSITSSERLARAADPAPALHASWARYVLMEMDGEWVIV